MRLQHMLGNLESVRDRRSAPRSLAWLSHALTMRGWALCGTGKGNDGLKLIEDGLAGELRAGALCTGHCISPCWQKRTGSWAMLGTV